MFRRPSYFPQFLKAQSGWAPTAPANQWTSVMLGSSPSSGGVSMAVEHKAFGTQSAPPQTPGLWFIPIWVAGGTTTPAAWEST